MKHQVEFIKWLNQDLGYAVFQEIDALGNGLS